MYNLLKNPLTNDYRSISKVGTCPSNSIHLLRCLKRFRIWSFSPRIKSKCGKIRIRKTPNTDTFHAVIVYVTI